MKKLSALFMLVVLIGAQGCDSDDNNNNNPSGNGKFEFKANGTLYQINASVAVNKNLTVAGNTLTFGAYNAGNTQSVVGGIDGYTGTGTYDMSADMSNYIMFNINSKQYYMTGGNSLAPKAHGVVIVTDEMTSGNFKNTKGTFTGVAYAGTNDSIVITEGVFVDSDF